MPTTKFLRAVQTSGGEGGGCVDCQALGALLPVFGNHSHTLAWIPLSLLEGQTGSPPSQGSQEKKGLSSFPLFPFSMILWLF